MSQPGRCDSRAEYSPSDLVYALPDSVDLVYGAMMEPLSVAVHAISNVGQLRTGQTVLIMGAGPVGLLAMGVAKGLGAGKIIAVDINEERLNFAKGYAATHTYIPVRPRDKQWGQLTRSPSRTRVNRARRIRFERQKTFCSRPARRSAGRGLSISSWTRRALRRVSRWG